MIDVAGRRVRPDAHIPEPAYDGDGIGIVNSPGLIDSGYRGEILVVLLNTGREIFSVEPGMRIAQLVVVPVAAVRLVEVDELAASHRGDQGFGSSSS